MAGNKIKEILKNKSFVVGFMIFMSVIACALFADYIALYPYDEMHLMDKLQQPSSTYFLGTDMYGRCIFSRIIYGARIALKAGLIISLIQAGIGVTLGLLSGYYGGVIRKIIMFITDIVWSLPMVMMALAIVTILGPGLTNVIIAVALVGWGEYTRIIDAKAQIIKTLPFVDAGRVLGESDFNIIVRYILPNLINQIIILVSLKLTDAVISISALGFLGLGTQPPASDWGVMLSEGVNYLKNTPWMAIAPGLFLIYTVLGFNILGEGLKEILDPK